LDNRSLALDNIVCYVANRLGIDVVNAAIRKVNGNLNLQLSALHEVFSIFLRNASACDRALFRKVLLELIGTEESDLAEEAGIYLSSHQLRELVAQFRFEIGDHTYSHPHCRSLSNTDFTEEIDRNKRDLELISGAPVRSFSVPYGSTADLTPVLVAHLRRCGYKAAFLSESRVNTLQADPFRLNRISIKTGQAKVLFSEIEVLPRLRSMRDLLFKTAMTIAPVPCFGETRDTLAASTSGNAPQRANSPMN
jgi:Polysaccharide deacetylase